MDDGITFIRFEFLIIVLSTSAALLAVMYRQCKARQ